METNRRRHHDPLSGQCQARRDFRGFLRKLPLLDETDAAAMSGD
jgi:hypothetical protein